MRLFIEVTLLQVQMCASIAFQAVSFAEPAAPESRALSPHLTGGLLRTAAVCLFAILSGALPLRWKNQFCLHPVPRVQDQALL